MKAASAPEANAAPGQEQGEGTVTEALAVQQLGRAAASTAWQGGVTAAAAHKEAAAAATLEGLDGRAVEVVEAQPGERAAPAATLEAERQDEASEVRRNVGAR
jgi:hypothetical protein